MEMVSIRSIELESYYRNLHKIKRRIVFDELPIEWDGRVRVKLASSAAKKSKNAWQDYPNNFHEMAVDSLKRIDKNYLKYKSVISSLNELCSIRLLNRDIAVTAEKMGLTIEQMNLAFKVLLKVSDEHESPIFTPRESKNKKTEARLHDLAVGKVLVDGGLTRKKASRVLAKIRLADPHAGISDPKKPKIITDTVKEAKAVEQCLRNDGL
jgi:hypothetical protein